MAYGTGFELSDLSSLGDCLSANPTTSSVVGRLVTYGSWPAADPPRQDFQIHDQDFIISPWGLGCIADLRLGQWALGLLVPPMRGLQAFATYLWLTNLMNRLQLAHSLRMCVVLLLNVCIESRPTVPPQTHLISTLAGL